MYYADVATTALLLNLSVNAIYARFRRGKMPFIKYGGGYLIALVDIAKELGTTKEKLFKQMLRRQLPIYVCE